MLSFINVWISEIQSRQFSFNNPRQNTDLMKQNVAKTAVLGIDN